MEDVRSGSEAGESVISISDASSDAPVPVSEEQASEAKQARELQHIVHDLGVFVRDASASEDPAKIATDFQTVLDEVTATNLHKLGVDTSSEEVIAGKVQNNQVVHREAPQRQKQSDGPPKCVGCARRVER